MICLALFSSLLFCGKHTAGKIQQRGGRRSYREWKEQRKRGRRRNRERMIESERKKSHRSRDRKREGNGGPPAPAPLLSSSLSITSEGERNLLPGRFSSFVRFVLILLSFRLKITQRKCLTFYITCPPFPMVESESSYSGKLDLKFARVVQAIQENTQCVNHWSKKCSRIIYCAFRKHSDPLTATFCSYDWVMQTYAEFSLIHIHPMQHNDKEKFEDVLHTYLKEKQRLNFSSHFQHLQSGHVVNLIDRTWFRKEHILLYKSGTADNECQRKNNLKKKQAMKWKELLPERRDMIHIWGRQRKILLHWRFPRAQWPP